MEQLPPEYEQELRFRARRELRKRLERLRASLPPGAVKARSERIVERVLALEAWKSARTVALFWSFPEEVQLAGLARSAHEAGLRVALPVVVDAPALLFRELQWEGAEPVLERGPMRLLEPGARCPVIPPEEVDVVLVPGLAFDTRGHRLGYGRGYYDRTLPLLTRALRVGVCFDFQLLAELPNHAGDVPVHTILSDKLALEVGASES